MRIEMFGPPTSGKSSLVRELTMMGIGRGYIMEGEKIPKQWEPFKANIEKAYIEHPGLKTLPGKSINALHTAAYGDKFKGWIVYDELVALCGISMAIRHDPWQWYFEQMPMPALLVVLECSEQTLINRNKARAERSRIDKTMRAVSKIRYIMPILDKRGANILKLNTDQLTTKQCAKEVIQCL